MTDTPDAPPTLAERLSSAATTSDLTVDLDRRRPVDVLIAAGKAAGTIGRFLDAMVSEWDATPKPRRLTVRELTMIAEQMPRVASSRKVRGRLEKVMALDMAGAIAAEAAHRAAERRRILLRMRAVQKLLHPHAGLLTWLAAKKCSADEGVVVDVLGWYLERQCEACHGTKWGLIEGTNRQSNRACGTCRGTGLRLLPHGRLGQDVLHHLEECASTARSSTKQILRNIRDLKYIAAGRM